MLKLPHHFFSKPPLLAHEPDVVCREYEVHVPKEIFVFFEYCCGIFRIMVL